MTSNDLEYAADAAATRQDYQSARDLLVEATQHDPDRFDLWLKLAAMSKATGDIAHALSATERALAIRPLDFTALLLRAMQLEALGNANRAGLAFGRAIAQAPEPVPPQLRAVFDHAADRYGAWQDDQSALLRASVPRRSPRVERMITNAVRLTTPDRVGPTHYCYPDLPEIPFHDRERFSWIAKLEAATAAVAAEFAAVAASQVAELVPYIQYPEAVPLDQWKTLNHNRDWTAIHLIERGCVVDANARHCPITINLLRDIPQPDIPGAGPNAMFSMLAPHTHIPPHNGIANTRLVCHLPLIVPPGCWFRVGKETRAWQLGQAWVFDDTIEHEAMNPSDSLRVILIIDCWHPDLSKHDRADIAAVIGVGGQVHGL